jgi:hypothetical protein
MPELNEIDYRTQIESSIKDFSASQTAMAGKYRLLLWILLETAILALVTLSNGWPDVARYFIGTITGSTLPDSSLSAPVPHGWHCEIQFPAVRPARPS